MTRNINTFEININSTSFIVEPGFTGLKVYRLYNDTSGYVIAKDFYGVWVELNRIPGSINISLNQVGRQIEEHYVIPCYAQ
ncbi:MAG: hypothetical protein ACHQHN_12805 [Sphingobacteriales bacterium]